MRKAFVAMSGGVDSSTAAYLMQAAGYDVTGVIMRLYDNEIKREDGSCVISSLVSVEDARKVTESLGMELLVYDFREEFRRKVIDGFISAYENGQTPNPCVECNRYLKFEGLYHACMEDLVRRSSDASPAGERDLTSVIATGHYAVIEKGSGRYMLRKAADPGKDQSYFLYALTQEQLARTVFPLGGLSKAEVREIAGERGFVTAGKKESQDICFVPGGDYAGFITGYTGRTYPPGDFTDADGNVMGTHRGIINYTVGQRKGLGLSLKKPAYVCSLDAASNRVILGDDADLFRRELTVRRWNWLSTACPEKSFRASARIRYRHKESPAEIIPLAEDRVRIIFDEPQRAVTPGQSAVAYDGDYVIGGGIIE